MQAKLSAAIAEVERKLQKVQGLELKELRAIFNRLKASQTKLDRIKEKIRKSSRAHSAKAMKAISDMMQKVETKLASLSPNVGIGKLDESQDVCQSLVSLVAEAQKDLADA